MILVKFMDGDTARWGEQDGDRVHVLASPPYGGIVRTGEVRDRAAIRLVAPCDPTKIVAVGKNYADHIAEFDSIVPEDPTIFLKPPTSLNDPGAEIPLPAKSMSKRIDYEGELAFVVGRKARNISAEHAADYILGYTILNDVTARDLQRKDGQWTRAKGFDGFAPVGPVLVDGIDPLNCEIRTRLNGKTVQKSNTGMMLWNVYQLFAFITAFMTLLPGDVVTTGTPEGVGEMAGGDVVEIEVQGIGVLRNTAVCKE
jgi:2-keto-4-pentenoate hydratase/2-oxohepta-3-ene-1,7-dioic acid hydratase in catechol pathway